MPRNPVVIVATAVALAVILQGCGGDGGDDAAQTTATTTAATTIAPLPAPTSTTVDGRGGSSEEVPGLVFQSGFEDGTVHTVLPLPDVPCTDDLNGEDLSVDRLGDWDNDLEGGAFGRFSFCFGGGDTSQRSLDLVADPEDPSNQVLYGRIVEPNEILSDTNDTACDAEELGRAMRKARIQAVVQDNLALTQLAYRVRIRLGEAFGVLEGRDEAITWMTIGEVWNNQPAEDGTFRVTINMVKDRGPGPFRFGVKADKQDDGIKRWIPVWPGRGEVATDVEVPIGEWFVLDVLVIEGDDTGGRVRVVMTDAQGVSRTVIDETNWTYSPDGVPDGFQDFNPLKLYTSGDTMCRLKNENGVALEIWWDDFALGAPG